MLYHFSEDAHIARFEPRRIEARPEIERPLVWAVDAEHAFTYCFPRDCPRIVVWPLPGTSLPDRERWFGASDARAIAHIEYDWLDRMHSTALVRYSLPETGFVAAGAEGGPGNFVSGEAVTPVVVEPVGDLVQALRRAGVELRLLQRLTPLRGLWETSLHVSGFRLRNAQGWELVR